MVNFSQNDDDPRWRTNTTLRRLNLPSMIAAMRRLALTAVAVFLLAAVAPPRPVEAGEVTAIETSGSGNLTMCPLRAFGSCYLYHRVKLPLQMTIGDKVRVHFGSNPKEYDFPVVRIIVRDRGGCTVFSQLTKTEDVEKIEVPSCNLAPVR
jgi:hypothetical protein